MAVLMAAVLIAEIVSPDRPGMENMGQAGGMIFPGPLVVSATSSTQQQINESEQRRQELEQERNEQEEELEELVALLSED